MNGTSSISHAGARPARVGGQAGWRGGGARAPRAVPRTSDRGRAGPDRSRLACGPHATASAAASMPSSTGSSRPLGLGRSPGGRSAGTRSGGAACSTPGSERLAANWSAELPTAEEARPPAHNDTSAMANTRNTLVADCCRCIRMAVRPYWILWQTPRCRDQPCTNTRPATSSRPSTPTTPATARTAPWGRHRHSDPGASCLGAACGDRATRSAR
jgi:hypothetical protein